MKISTPVEDDSTNDGGVFVPGISAVGAISMEPDLASAIEFAIVSAAMTVRIDNKQSTTIRSLRELGPAGERRCSCQPMLIIGVVMLFGSVGASVSQPPVIGVIP